LRRAAGLQVMEEIIAKSKHHKAEKQMQKEEDVAALEALDAQFKELVRAQALASYVRAKGKPAPPTCVFLAAQRGLSRHAS
jgi:Nop14-like family